VAENPDGGEIEIWGDGLQTRSFLYIDQCLEGVRRLMDSDIDEPINIGSNEIISINGLAKMIMLHAKKKQKINHIPGPLGVRERNSDNNLILEKLNWAPEEPLVKGIEWTYDWISKQIANQK
jgi:GDP-D-mannose 3', 5'-epimerase